MFKTRRQQRLLAVLIAPLAGGYVAMGCGLKDALNGEPPITQAPPQRQLNQPIQHVWVIFKENHTYDNYFAAYPNPTGDAPVTSGLGANGRIVPLASRRRTTSRRATTRSTWPATDFDGGSLDGFDQAAHQPLDGNVHGSHLPRGRDRTEPT